MTAEQLEAIIVKARELGAKRIKIADTEVEFWAPQGEAQGAPIPAEPEDCRCGHSLIEHNEVGCLRGCDVLACEEKA